MSVEAPSSGPDARAERPQPRELQLAAVRYDPADPFIHGSQACEVEYAVDADGAPEVLAMRCSGGDPLYEAAVRDAFARTTFSTGAPVARDTMRLSFDVMGQD